MTLSVSTVGDLQQQPGITATTYIPDQLVAGTAKIITKPITVAAGTLLRGTVLGQRTVGAATSAAKAGSNTGTGTLVLDATTPILANAEPGVYTVRAITASANAATFRVTSPKGTVLGDVSFNGSGASATFADRIKFVVTDGATDFVVGDGFDVTIAAGDGSFLKSVATAVDGTQSPSAILVDDCDASGGPVTTGAYVFGEFNQNAIIYDPSWSVNTLEPIMRPLGIFLKTFVSAGDPT